MGSWRPLSKAAKAVLKKVCNGKLQADTVDKRCLRPLVRLGYISVTKRGIVSVKKAGRDFLAKR